MSWWDVLAQGWRGGPCRWRSGCCNLGAASAALGKALERGRLPLREIERSGLRRTTGAAGPRCRPRPRPWRVAMGSRHRHQELASRYDREPRLRHGLFRVLLREGRPLLLRLAVPRQHRVDRVPRGSQGGDDVFRPEANPMQGDDQILCLAT